MSSLPRIPHNRPIFGEEEVQAAADVVRSGYWAGGPKLKELEQSLAERANVLYTAGVASGFGALRLSLLALGVHAGDEVIIPAYSCVALANAVLALGALPIAVDVSDGEWTIDPLLTQNACTKRTKAIIAVHMYGRVAPIEELRPLGIPIIEDCAHAFGIAPGKSPLGSRGNAAILSFYATKLLAAGEGGAVLTNDASMDATVRQWRDYADQPPEATRLNDKMSDIEAALALCQLKRLDTMIASRQRLAERYDEHLRPLAERTQAFYIPDITSQRVWYRYAVEMTSLTAKETIARLAAAGVSSVSPACDWRQEGREKHPVTNRAYEHLISLPLYPTLTEEEQERVCEAVERIVHM